MSIEHKIQARMRRIRPTRRIAPRLFKWLLIITILLNLILLAAIKGVL